MKLSMPELNKMKDGSNVAHGTVLVRQIDDSVMLRYGGGDNLDGIIAILDDSEIYIRYRITLSSEQADPRIIPILNMVLADNAIKWQLVLDSNTNRADLHQVFRETSTPKIGITGSVIDFAEATFKMIDGQWRLVMAEVNW